MACLLAFLIGVVVGLRSLAAPAVVSWAASLGWVPVGDTALAFLGFPATPYVFTLFALGELIADKLPKTPSRKAPLGLIARVSSGALCGAALGAPSHALIGGLAAGIVGALVGTFGGYEFRVRLVNVTGGNDLKVALMEDAIAIGGAWLIVSRF